MFHKALARKLYAGLLILALLLPSFSCKSAPVEPLPANPFTTDYNLDQASAGFFTSIDSIEMLLSASPFYVADQPLPSQKTDVYDNARAKKVDEIKKEAESLFKAVIKFKPRLDEVRSAYLTYLQTILEADPKLRALVTGILVPLQSLTIQEAILESEYNAIVADGLSNTFARAFLDYMKVAKAVELGGLYLQDTGNLAEYAALILTVLGRHDNAAVKQASEKLDQEMKSMDGLRSDAWTIVSSLQKIDYGLKQLSGGSYYFNLAVNDFIADSLRDLEVAADKLVPRHGLTKEDIQAIQAFLGLFERWQYQVKRQAEAMDKAKLLKVSAGHEGKPGIVYAAEPPGNYASSVGVLQGPLKADESANKKSDYFAKEWAEVRKTLDIIAPEQLRLLRAARQAIGVTIDVTKLLVDFEINANFGRFFYNITPADIRDDIRKDWNAVQENFKNNMSGVEVLKAAESGLTTVEKRAGELGAAGARAIGVEDQWMASAVGEAARLTVGLFTGLVRDMYTLANQASTPADVALASVGVALAITGGSKSVLSAPMLKSAEEKLAGDISLRFVNSVMAREAVEAEAVRAILRGAKAEADSLIRLHTARQGIENALRDYSRKLLADLERQGGLASFSGRAKETAAESLRDLFKKNFDLSLGGIRDALKTVAGKNDWEYAVNLLSALGDEQFKNLLVKVLGEDALNELDLKSKTMVSRLEATPKTPTPAPTPTAPTQAPVAAPPPAIAVPPPAIAAPPPAIAVPPPAIAAPPPAIAGEPDLTVTDVSFSPSTVKAGQMLTVSFTVTNKGVAASGLFSNRVSLATTRYGTDFSLGDFPTESLPAETSRPFTVSVVIPSSLTGDSYWVTVFTDGLEQIDESDENNNIGSSEDSPAPNKFTLERTTFYEITLNLAINTDGLAERSYERIVTTESAAVTVKFSEFRLDLGGAKNRLSTSRDGNTYQYNGSLGYYRHPDGPQYDPSWILQAEPGGQFSNSGVLGGYARVDPGVSYSAGPPAKVVLRVDGISLFFEGWRPEWYYLYGPHLMLNYTLENFLLAKEFVLNPAGETVDINGSFSRGFDQVGTQEFSYSGTLTLKLVRTE